MFDLSEITKFVYAVVGECGEYSDWTSWVIAIFDLEADAEKHCLDLADLDNELRLHEEDADCDDPQSHYQELVRQFQKLNSKEAYFSSYSQPKFTVRKLPYITSKSDKSWYSHHTGVTCKT